MPPEQPQFRRRRARHVCTQCHDRKLKCDLEVKTRNGFENCTNCTEAASFCQKRLPKRYRRKANLAEKSLRSNHYAAIQPAIRDRSTEIELASTEPEPLQREDRVQQGIFPHGNDLSYDSSPSRQRIPSPIPLSVVSTEQQNPSSQATRPCGSAMKSPTNPSTASSGTVVGYLGDSGILTIFEPDHRGIAATNQGTDAPSNMVEMNLPPLELQQSFAETYFEYCWPWCPIFDKSNFWEKLESSQSPLLINALALLGSRIRPPIIPHSKDAEYYHRAKMLFYTDHESNPIICLQAIMLFYWWAPRGPSLVHKDAAWWWTGLAIKYAQQMGLHREPKNVQDVGGPAMQGLRKRIWWTLFSRERLTALCQGRPCTINPDDCNVQEPTLEDFSSSEDPRAEIFIYWVRLCGIIGRVGQHLSRHPEQASFPTSLAEQLIEWVQSLPNHLSLPSMADRRREFNRDVHKLHLPYLTTITILHMNRASQNSAHPLPEVYTTAVLSASCVARIFKELLARGHIRFLGAIACWYVGVAIVALLHTQRIERLAESGTEDIRVLRLALNELASLWPSAAIFVKGFERLKVFEQPGQGYESLRQNTQPGENTDTATSPALSDLNWVHGIDWQSYFPFATSSMSGLASILLAEHQTEPLEDFFWLGDPTTQLLNLLDLSETFQDQYTMDLPPL